MGYGGGGGGGGGSGGSGGSGGGSGYRRVGEDRTANLKVNNITNRTGGNGTDVDGVIEAKGTHFIPPSGTTAERGSRGRGVIMGGTNPGGTNEIEYVTIATLGNATDFGDLTSSTKQIATCASSTRGIRGGGYGTKDTIDYVTISSTGNAFDFGDLLFPTFGPGSCSSSTRGIIAGGWDKFPATVYEDAIQYITMASKGDSVDFGNLLKPRAYVGQGVSNGTRGVFSGGYVAPTTRQNLIEYITIATTGNSQYFGDLTVARDGYAAVSNTIRGVFGGGSAPVYSDYKNIMDYITIATTGNALDFGDLSVDRAYFTGGCSNATRGLFCGGYDNPSPLTRTATIDYITIMSVGNAADFGDLLSQKGAAGGLSDSHGGLG